MAWVSKQNHDIAVPGPPQVTAKQGQEALLPRSRGKLLGSVE